MPVARTTRGISGIPGVSTFRSTYQPQVFEPRVTSIDPCGTCGKKFRPFTNSPWDEIMQDVVEHLRLCDRVTKHRVTKQLVQNQKGGTKKSDKRARERQTFLEKDPWIALVEPTQVRCGACGSLLQLDKRRAFYPGLWNNHRIRCLGIDHVFKKAERALLPIVRTRFLLQQKPPGRQFSNFQPPNTREIRKQTRKRKETERRRNRRAKISNLENNSDTEDDEMYGSDEEETSGAATARSADHSQHPRTLLSAGNSNIMPERRALQLALPTTSKSLNAILCPITAEEIASRHRQLVGTDSSQGQELQEVANGADVNELWKNASNQKRYHPYAHSVVVQPGSRSGRIGRHSIGALTRNKSNLTAYPDKGRCSIQSQSRIDSEFCVYSGFSGQSEDIDFSSPTTPSLRPEDITNDNGTRSSYVSSPLNNRGQKRNGKVQRAGFNVLLSRSNVRGDLPQVAPLLFLESPALLSSK